MTNGNTETQVAVLDERVNGLLSRIKSLEKEVDSFKTAANRWKGGVVVLVALGSIIGWLAAIWDKIVRAMH